MPLSRACCKLRRCEPVQARVRSECVVVDPSFFDGSSGLWQAGEEVLVEALVAQSAIEALDEAVLGRLAGRDVVPFHALSSCQARMAREVNSAPLSLTTMQGVPRIYSI